MGSSRKSQELRDAALDWWLNNYPDDESARQAHMDLLDESKAYNKKDIILTITVISATFLFAFIFGGRGSSAGWIISFIGIGLYIYLKRGPFKAYNRDWYEARIGIFDFSRKRREENDDQQRVFDNAQRTLEFHGQKGWATEADILSTFNPEKGIYIGAGTFWNGKGHLLTVGSSRAGKGVNFIIPCLLSEGFANSGSSFICLDPKGENAAITSRTAKENGFDIHVLNPFSIGDLPNSCFNPFDLTTKDAPDVVDFCDMMSEMVIPYHPHSNATNDHFDTQARNLLSAYMLHMLASSPKEEINFGTLFKWANYSGDQYEELLIEMSTSTEYGGLLSSLVSGFIETKSGGGQREASGILSSMRRGLSPFKNPQLQKATSKSDFDIFDLVNKQTGIFVCLQQSQMAAYAVWLRLVIGSALKFLQRHYNKNRRVLFLLDEFPTLGYVREIEQNIGFIAGYNVSFWVIVQSLAQLKSNYPNSWEVFTANAIIEHYLKVGDLTTSQYVSTRLPEIVEILQEKHGFKELKKPLLSPSEVENFQDVITFSKECSKPIWLAPLPYYKDSYFADKADPNPYI